MRSMMIAIKMTVVLTVLLGIVYPLAMAGIARVLFPAQAEGSLIYRNGAPMGSSLMGQNFKSPGYFRSRPSAAGNNGYDPTSSSGSNLGPTNKSLIDSVKAASKNHIEGEPEESAVGGSGRYCHRFRQRPGSTDQPCSGRNAGCRTHRESPWHQPRHRSCPDQLEYRVPFSRLSRRTRCQCHRTQSRARCAAKQRTNSTEIESGSGDVDEVTK